VDGDKFVVVVIVSRSIVPYLVACESAGCRQLACVFWCGLYCTYM